MINATDLKNGVMFLMNDKPYQVIKYSLIKMGRGGATVKVNARNLESGGVETKSLSSDTKVSEIDTKKRKLSYLYKDSKSATFMDPLTFEQVEISISELSDNLIYIKEGENIDVLFWAKSGVNDKALTVDLPPKVVLTVIACDPGVKGNSASNIYKQARLENGLDAKVPLFINVGDKVKIDTRTGDYVERVKDK